MATRPATLVPVRLLAQVTVEDLRFEANVDDAGDAPLHPLPPWARFMAHVGRGLAEAELRRVIVALSVPARDFAAVFAAAAAVLRRDELEPMAPNDLDEHVRALRATPLGAPVKYLGPKDRVHDGRWAGIQRSGAGGEEMLCLELARGETRKLRLNRALAIHLTGENSARGKLRAKVVAVAPLLRATRGDAPAITMVTTARCDILIVGTLTLLEQELTNERLFVSDQRDDRCEGVLQNLVRAHGLSDARRFFRSVLVASSSGPSAEQRALHPHLVIYDGGRAFIRWRHLWDDANKLVILDRSSSSAEEAGDELAGAFGYRSADARVLDGLAVPAGVEAIAFEAAP